MSAQPSEAVERRIYNALWWAKVQSAGPLEIDPDTPAVAGLTRATSADGSTVWLVPTLPSGAGHSVLEELDAPPVAVEQPNETARVLAICVACCWTDRSAPAWPGATGTLAQVRSVYAGMRGRPEQSSDLTLIVGSLRRLHATHWIRWDEKAGEVRLGPRVITWTAADLSTLRDLCRHLPDPPPPVLSPEPPTKPTPEDALPDDALPDDARSDHAVRNDALPDRSLPNDAPPKGPLLEDALPDDAPANDTRSDDALSDDPLSDDALPDGPSGEVRREVSDD